MAKSVLLGRVGLRAKNVASKQGIDSFVIWEIAWSRCKADLAIAQAAVLRHLAARDPAAARILVVAAWKGLGLVLDL